MKRITVEEAEMLVPYTDDLINGNIEYFTITPSDKGDGWEDVHYYTSRKTNKYSTVKVMVILGFTFFLILLCLV